MIDKGFDLKGRRALVTGSGEGIGRAIATALASNGAEVVVHAKDEHQKCEQLVTELTAHGWQASYCVGDLSNEGDVKQIIDVVRQVDVLVLNASVQIKSSFEDVTSAAFMEQVNVNVWSSIRLIQHFSKEMRERRWGRILVLGSVQQIRPHPHMSIYAGTKAFLGNLVRNLATQFAPDQVTVNCLSPGVIMTARNDDALADSGYAAKVMAKIPMASFGQPEDCAGIALTLCSDAGRYITGQTIYCDGGMSL